MREDLQLAAYAVALGFSLRIDSHRRRGEPVEPADFIRGIPHDGLQFERGNVSVWQTARGWRASKRGVDGRYMHPAPATEFHEKLLAALDAGAALAAADALTVEGAGYRIRTFDGFMRGAVTITAFDGAAHMTDAEKRAKHDGIRDALRERAGILGGSHVVYDPNGDEDGWLLVGEESAIRAETEAMLREE